MSRNLTIYLLLIVTTASVYGQVIQFDFIEFDDQFYIQQNRHVSAGLTREGIKWAFTATEHSTWQPLTWLSLMLDAKLYGTTNAGGYHLTNLLLHIANTIILFGLLHSMTAATWRNAFVAALFALHPLHVESVVWVAARKDVLSGLFGLLAIWAYASYARRSGIGCYLLTTAMLAMGLMAKPMLVTLPMVFLLLDYWPLNRIRLRRSSNSNNNIIIGNPSLTSAVGPHRSVGFLVVEKAPLFVLSAASSIVTFSVQRLGNAVVPIDQISLSDRIDNAFVSYARYIGKTIWPQDLSVLYPHPNLAGGVPWADGQVKGAAALLLAITILLMLLVRKRYAIIGWLWFLGMLVPVIGLVQIGKHAMADRFMYLPLIGLFIIAGWGLQDLIIYRDHRGQRIRSAVIILATVVFVACISCTWLQTQKWRNSETLFQHALTVTPNKIFMHQFLGKIFTDRNRHKEAIEHFQQAIKIKEDYLPVLHDLGRVLLLEEQFEESQRYFRRALHIDPNHADSLFHLGEIFYAQKKIDDAIRYYHFTLAAEPNHIQAMNNLGAAMAMRRQYRKAAQQFEHILKIEPDSYEAYINLGRTRLLQKNLPGHVDKAIRLLRRAVQINPNSADGHALLSIALNRAGRTEEALVQQSESDRLQSEERNTSNAP